LAADCTALDTPEIEINLEHKTVVQELTLHSVGKMHNVLGMWQVCQNLCGIQKESWAKNKQIAAVGYTLDTEEIIKASRPNFQHDGAAALRLCERSPLPLAISTENLP
jgi:hypothetical protein